MGNAFRVHSLYLGVSNNNSQLLQLEECLIYTLSNSEHDTKLCTTKLVSFIRFPAYSLSAGTEAISFRTSPKKQVFTLLPRSFRLIFWARRSDYS